MSAGHFITAQDAALWLEVLRRFTPTPTLRLRRLSYIQDQRDGILMQALTDCQAACRSAQVYRAAAHYREWTRTTPL